MNIESLRDYCLSKPYVSESLPFDDKTLVFKVAEKVFAITGLEDVPARVNLKCAPEQALELRDRYPEIVPGYHMNKKHWNTVYYGNLPDAMLGGMIDTSYKLVVSGLTKKKQKELGFYP
jgi:predicted DNA-binding protein (MmcQ/YjbR family)